MLAPVVLGWVTGRRPVWVSKRFEGKVLSLGTVLESLSRDDVVWGSGLPSEANRRAPEGARLLAVRGPLTRACIQGDVPEVYGDPACLLPRFHHPPAQKRWSVGLVPHHIDVANVPPVSDPQIKLVDVLRPWREVVDTIRGCDVVASSSLHGLIVAEAYGIPARWVSAPGVIGGTFKFRDYYLGTDREPPAPGRWSDDVGSLIAAAPAVTAHDVQGLIDAWHTGGAGR
jgi:pyruvyltransferase